MKNHPFQVGSFYINRNGRYEVLSIDDETGFMSIRYDDSGRETNLSIEIQMRILEAMGWESELPVVARQSKKFDYFKGFGESFEGLKANDFQRSTKGTHWRSRQGLAGKAALLLSADNPYSFISWSIFRWPVAFVTHREDYDMTKFDKGTKKAKFTIELDEESVYFGFYIEQNTGPMDHTWDWPRLINALENNRKLQSLIARVENQFNANFLARYSAGGKRFHFSNGEEMGAVSLWDIEQPMTISVEKRLALIRSIPNHHWGEIYILAPLLKVDALNARESVAEKITEMMRALIPIYRAAVTNT